MRSSDAAMQPPIRLCVLCAPLLMFAQACSQPAQDQASSGQAGTRPQQFTEEDRRVASALSIGNEAALAAADTPYDRALLCSVAVDSLAEQLRAKSLLDATQSRALEQANSLFARELERSAGGRTAAQIEQDYEELRQSEVEGSRMVQVAIGCLRRMQ